MMENVKECKDIGQGKVPCRSAYPDQMIDEEKCETGKIDGTNEV